MTKIEFIDWEKWHSEKPVRGMPEDIRAYLCDDKRVIGEWRRIFQ